LMHSNGTALLFRNNKLKHKLTVKHIPALYHSISTGCGNQVILIEFMKFTPLFYLELSWRQIFIVSRCYTKLRRMTRLNLDSSLLQPRGKPDRPRRSGNNTLTHTIIIWCGLREAIYSKCLFFIHEVRLWVPSIIPVLTLGPAVYFWVISALYYDACGRGEDLTDWSIDDFHRIH
jgi:hypothetical protein